MTPATSPASIRLLKVLPTLLCGGTENQVTSLSRALDSDRFDLEIACMRRVGPFVTELAERRVPVQEYPISSFWSAGAFSQQASLVRHIVRRRTQIVHTYSFYGNVFAIPPAAVAGVPVIIASVRDRGLYLTPLQKWAQKQVCRLAHRILVNANAVKEWLLEQGYPPEKIVVIRNGVDLSRFDVPPDAAAVRRQLGVAPGEQMVTVVSRVSRLKGLEQFIDAAAVLTLHFPTVRFLIVGEASPADCEYRAGAQAARRATRRRPSRPVHRPAIRRTGRVGKRRRVGDALAQRGALERSARIDGGREADRRDTSRRHT